MRVQNSNSTTSFKAKGKLPLNIESPRAQIRAEIEKNLKELRQLNRDTRAGKSKPEIACYVNGKPIWSA